MAGVAMCEPLELYNLLNQRRRVPRLAELNYLCVIDAREAQDYNVSHVITAKNAKMDSESRFLLPESVEVDSMRHLIVYDSSTSSLQDKGRALECARVLASVSQCPALIVRGGFRRFSALYPFLRTEKILYTIMELEDLKLYPVEILAGRLYMGDLAQGSDSGICKDLGIKAVVSVSESRPAQSTREGQTILHIPVDDSGISDLYSSFEKMCSFIGSHTSVGAGVLIVSRQGRSRCSAAAMAFLMHHLKHTLEEAWKHTLSCKPSMRPHAGLLQQLSDWELRTTGARATDVSTLDV